MTTPPTQTRRGKAGPWYAGGLRFTCTRCNRCCGGAPGYVWVDEAEVAAMAAHLAMSRAEFADEFCRRVWWRTSLRERADGDCALLTPRGCAVYEARPGQCRMFPFWPDNVSSEEAWQRVKRRCPGAGRGRLYSAAEVEHIAGGEGAA